MDKIKQIIEIISSVTGYKFTQEIWDHNCKIEVGAYMLFEEPIKRIVVATGFPSRILEIDSRELFIRYTQAISFLMFSLYKAELETKRKLKAGWIWNPNLFILEHPNKFIRTWHRLKRWITNN